MINIKPEDKQKSKTFGWGLAGLLAIIGILKILFGKPEGIPWHFYAVLITLAVNIVVPLVIFSLYKAATFLARYLGWFNTRLILGLIFFLLFTPLGFILRLLGKDFLDRKFDMGAHSYWIKREKREFNPASLENQF
jgi:hypothetical protein